MRALKSLVVGLGILIVVAMGALAWGLYHKANDPGFQLFGDPTPGGPKTSPTGPGPAVSAAPPAAFGDRVIPLPAGCSIAEMRPQGARLFIRFGPAGSCERVVVIDTATGETLGTIRGSP